MKSLQKKHISFALRIALGGMFLYASLGKVQNPHQFGIIIRGYEIIPASLSNLFGLVLAWSETLAGSLLILGAFTRQAAATTFMMSGMFVVAIISVVARGMEVDCGCFKSEGGSSVGWPLLIRNMILIGTALFVMRYDEGFLGLSSLVRSRRPSAAA